jgi:predicted acyl esterase
MIDHRKLRYMVLRTVATASIAATALAGFQAHAGAPSPLQAIQSTGYPGGIWEPGPPRYGVNTVSGVPVIMDDGVTLYADIAYPTDLTTGQRAPGSFPVALQHTPYIFPLDTYFTQYGYISVKVCARGGCSNSGGDVQYYTRRDGLDGKAIIDWAARLTGANGRVGQVGCSYPGGLSLADAAYAGPNSPLKATVAQCTGLNALVEGYLPGGIPSQSVAATGGLGLIMGGNSQTIQFFKDLAADTLAGGDTAYIRAFWQERLALTWTENIVANNIPILLWSGWQDVYTASSLQTYSSLQNAHAHRDINAPMRSHQPVTPRYQIIMGDWGHGGGLDDGIALEWLETWVRGVNTGLQSAPTTMHSIEKGTNRYINTTSYPTVNEYTRYLISSSGDLGREPKYGSGSQALMWGPPSTATGRLTYTTPPLRESTSLSGPSSATIYALSSNTNLELIVKLYDVAPNGATTQITHGVVLGSQRRLNDSLSWMDRDGQLTRPWTVQAEDDYLRSGQVYKLEVAIRPIQWGIAPGHRIQLEFTTQATAAECAAGVGSDPCVLTTPQNATVPGGTYTILSGSRWPSGVNLPLVPARCFATATSGATPTSNGVIEPLDWRSNRQDEDCDADNRR